MKTRIVYPRLWLDEKFAACSVPTKLLFCYLINNIQLGLSRYLHITDRQIMFDTGLDVNQLKTGKEELTALKWVLFAENWVYHNHSAAYIDYEGRDRVLEAKEQEVNAVPDKIKSFFKGLVTGYQPVLNPKYKTINHNKGGVGGEVPKVLFTLTDEERSSLVTKYPELDIGDEYEAAHNWLLSEGKTKRDYWAYMQNWCRRSAKTFVTEKKNKKGVSIV